MTLAFRVDQIHLVEFILELKTTLFPIVLVSVYERAMKTDPFRPYFQCQTK